MTKTFSVTEVNIRIKEILEERTRGKDLWIQGQIFDIGASKAGHLYFRLQDRDSRLACIAFRTTAERLPSLEDGMTVKAMLEAFSLYPHGGQYQAIVKELAIEDATTYRERREQTLKKLEEEAQRPRQQIPSPLHDLGIIAAEDSEVIEDIKGREWPDDLEVTIHGTAMQGPDAPGEIAKAISALNALGGIETILITRGGGDYWEIAEVFDNEGLARSRRASINRSTKTFNSGSNLISTDSCIEPPWLDLPRQGLGQVVPLLQDDRQAVQPALHLGDQGQSLARLPGCGRRWRRGWLVVLLPHHVNGLPQLLASLLDVKAALSHGTTPQSPIPPATGAGTEPPAAGRRWHQRDGAGAGWLSLNLPSPS